MSDELAEINGVKPKVFLLDGEEKDVNSTSSNSVYKVKRTFDHFYWPGETKFVSRPSVSTVPDISKQEWPPKARLKFKNPNGLPSKPASKKSVSKTTKPPAKRKKADQDEEDDDPKPSKRSRKPISTRSKKAVDEDDHSARRVRKPNSRSTSQTAKHAQKPDSQRKDNAMKDEKNDDGGLDEDNGNDEPPVSKSVPELLLANKWDIQTGPDPVGWWISEKLDGVRTYYDGKDMISRLGNPFTPPKWFLEKLPKDVTLDGELFGGRGQFQSTVSIVKTANSPHWKDITFQIFDIPSKGQLPFEKRIEFLKKLFGPGGDYASDIVKIVEHEKASTRQHVLDKLKEIEALGGEGLMLRKPASEYEGRRSGSLLKIKASFFFLSDDSRCNRPYNNQTFYDAEAVVIGYAPGKGRHQGSTGALKCRMQSGKTFNVGTGLSDKQRRNPPKINAIITYRFQELTRDGVPRFPSYVGEAVDKDEPKDAEIPQHRLSAAKQDNE
ncbi:hypothetical protein H0H93_016071 [Arthromyces matolae]|nr:hypothetical protein H0H93_016071 [Arthromyces matolae]